MLPDGHERIVHVALFKRLKWRKHIWAPVVFHKSRFRLLGSGSLRQPALELGVERNFDGLLGFPLGKADGAPIEVHRFPRELREVAEASTGVKSGENQPLPIAFGCIDQRVHLRRGEARLLAIGWKLYGGQRMG